MRYLLFILAILAFYGVYGQQVAPVTQFSLDPYFYNPAAAGSNNKLEAAVAYRKQWLGIENSPTMYFASVHKTIHVTQINSIFKNRYLRGHVQNRNMFEKKTSSRYVLKHALGVTIGTDQAGAFKRSQLGASYALHLPFNKFSIALGSTFGYGRFSFDPTQVSLLEDFDNTYESYLAQGTSTSFMNMMTGIYVYSDDFSIGYSTDQLLSDQLKFGSDTLEVDLNTHHYIQVGGKLDLNEVVIFKPNILLEAVSGLPINWHINTVAEFQKTYEIGLGLRRQDAVTLQAGYMHLEKFKLSYAYDINFSLLKPYNGGSHELIFLMGL